MINRRSVPCFPPAVLRRYGCCNEYRCWDSANYALCRRFETRHSSRPTKVCRKHGIAPRGESWTQCSWEFDLSWFSQKKYIVDSVNQIGSGTKKFRLPKVWQGK